MAVDPSVPGTTAAPVDPDAPVPPAAPVVVAPRIAQRYGRTARDRRGNRLLFVVVAAAFVAVFTGWVVWAGLDGGRGGVEATDTAHLIVDDRTIEVTFDLAAPPGSAVACAIEALDPSSAIVGWKVVEYPASDARQRSFTESLRTTELATTGLISSCWLS